MTSRLAHARPLARGRPATRRDLPAPRREALAPSSEDGTLSETPRLCPSCGRTFPADYLVCPRDGAPLGVAANEADPLIGAVLGGAYRIERGIARGGMGRLYQATHTRLPRKVAVKVLHEPHAQRPEAVRRFEREASALSRLDHPNVLGVLDFVRTPDGRGAIVTPLLEGESLQARLDRDGRLAPAEAVRLAADICSGLSAAHAEGIVHRDLKPSNVFLAQRAEDVPPLVKLLDFGVAKLDGDDMTRTGVVLGTPAFMAPEQASGSAHVDVRADVYAVGAMLYRMLTGATPYDGEDAGQVLARLLAGPPPRMGARAEVPEAIEEIVERAMARDPDERFASAARLRQALLLVVPSETAAAPEREAPSAPSRAVPRERALAALVATGTTIVGGAAATALVHLGARALDVDTVRGLALELALALVATTATLLALAMRLGREVRARFESATALRGLRRRLGLSTTVGLAGVGAGQIALFAAETSPPSAELAARALGAAIAGVAWLGTRARSAA